MYQKIQKLLQKYIFSEEKSAFLIVPVFRALIKLIAILTHCGWQGHSGEGGTGGEGGISGIP